MKGFEPHATELDSHSNFAFRFWSLEIPEDASDRIISINKLMNIVIGIARSHGHHSIRWLISNIQISTNFFFLTTLSYILIKSLPHNWVRIRSLRFKAPKISKWDNTDHRITRFFTICLFIQYFGSFFLRILLYCPILSLINHQGVKFFQILETLVIDFLDLLWIGCNTAFPINDFLDIIAWNSEILFVFNLFYIRNNLCSLLINLCFYLFVLTQVFWINWFVHFFNLSIYLILWWLPPKV